MAAFSLLMPVMWHLWLVTGAGNANFFYNQNMLFNIASAMLLLGPMGTSLARDKALRSLDKARRAVKRSE